MKSFDYESEKKIIEDYIANSVRPKQGLIRSVEEIIDNVRNDQDKALINYSNKFDDANFELARDFIVSEEEIKKAKDEIKPELLQALKNAFDRIYSYHKRQMPQDFEYVDEIGVRLGNLWRSIEKVGVYAPGGTASYPSSVLMCAVPALVAGVEEIYLCAPTSGGKISDAVLAAADICGIKKIYKIGGAQAIAALTFGTESIVKVDKIVGPGNSYVATAKKILFGEVGIDMIAGPTDLTVICDDSANAKYVASDIVSQLEHGVDSRAFVVTNDKKSIDKILVAISEMTQKLSRKEIIEKSLQNSAIIYTNDLEQAFEVVNKIAPEHLEIACHKAKDLVHLVKNAGAIFLGNYSAEAIGDYIAGPSHTLPTSSTSRFSSGLSVYDFVKRISLISCNKEGFDHLAQDAITIAQSEGLDGHAVSVKVRQE